MPLRSKRITSSCVHPFFAILLILLIRSLASADDRIDPLREWPQWRGPLANGVASHAHPPLRWKSADSERENVAWVAEVPGNSLSTPVVWGDQTTRRGFGEGASPALDGDRLLVPWDHEGESFVVALDTRTGKELWRTDRPGEVTTWATPLVADDGFGKQVVLPGTGKSRGYDLATGKELWSLAGMTVNTIPSPALVDGIVYLASGYRGNMVQAVDLAAARRLGGDIQGKEAVLWSHEKHTPYVPSVVVADGLIYFIKHFKNILSCLDARTGELKFEKRIDGLTNVWSSPAVADGRLYVVGRDGKTAVLRVAPEYELLALNELDDRIDASPVFVGDRLYLRGRERLYALETSGGK